MLSVILLSHVRDTKLKAMEKNETVLTFEKTDYIFKADNDGVYVSEALGTLTADKHGKKCRSSSSEVLNIYKEGKY